MRDLGPNQIFEILWFIAEKLISLSIWAWNFLTTSLDFGIIKIDIWALIGGVGLTALIIIKLFRG